MPTEQDEIANLRLALAEEWLSNHAGHCGARVPPWPHSGVCNWPLPRVLATMPPDSLNEILSKIVGASDAD